MPLLIQVSMHLPAKHRCLILTLLLFLALALPVTELYLTLKGKELYQSKWKYQPGIGWSSQPGLIKSYEGRGIFELFWENGARASRYPRLKPASQRVAVVGCSFTEGVGVRDQETFVWQLNDRFPHTTFENYGCCGYGAYQCMLRMQDILSKDKYDLVLYCVIGDHLLRFVKPAACWITSFSDDQLSIMPWIQYGSYGNIYHPGYTLALPGARRFLSVELLNYALIEGFSWLHPRPDWETINTIFERTIQEMQSLCNRHHVRFALVWLQEKRKLDTLHLHVPICQAFHPQEQDGDLPMRYKVEPEQDAHPNHVVHHYWALVIGRWLEKQGYVKK